MPTTPKRERDSSDNEEKSPTSLKKKSPTKTLSSPTGTGGKKEKRPWTRVEDAAILKSLHDIIAKHQIDYSTVLPDVKEAAHGVERSKIAVRDRWSNTLKPKMLELTGPPKDAE